MIVFPIFPVLCLLATQQHDVKHVLCRASIYADKASVVLVGTEPRKLGTIDVGKSYCDGTGWVFISSVDIAPPWNQKSMHLPATISRGKQKYPDILLRHSHSRFGLYILNLGNFENDDDYSGGLMSASIPRIERADFMMNSPPFNQDQNLTIWNMFGLEIANGPWMTPLFDDITRTPGKPDAKKIDRLFYDFVVNNSAEVEFYVAKPNSTIERYTRSVLPSRQMLVPGGNELKPWDKPSSVSGDLSGPFAVVPHGRSRYLITHQGNLVRFSKDGVLEKNIVTVFDKSPIRAIVHDTDEDKRYAFTTEHFFEVDEPIVLKPHGVKAFDTSNGALGLETSFHCARAVRGLPPIEFPKAKP